MSRLRRTGRRRRTRRTRPKRRKKRPKQRLKKGFESCLLFARLRNEKQKKVLLMLLGACGDAARAREQLLRESDQVVRTSRRQVACGYHQRDKHADCQNGQMANGYR